MWKEIYGWGKYPRVKAQVYEPETIDELVNIVKNEPELLARGMGKSYGDAGLFDKVISLKYFDKIHQVSDGVIEVEAGCSLLKVLETIVPNKKFLKVTPGICGISIGGAIASDVHGKNHFNSGSFYNMVSEIKVIDPEGHLLILDKEKDAVIFGSFFGSMGLKGVVVSAKIQLTELKGLMLKEVKIPVESIDEFIDVFEEHLCCNFCVGWLNLAGKEAQLLVKAANWISESDRDRVFIFNKRRYALFPFEFPVRIPKWAFNLFNKRYYAKALQKQEHIVKMENYFYPLDTITNWNNVYGRKGLLQYHFNVGLHVAKEALDKAVKMVLSGDATCTMAVIKRFGKRNDHTPYSFPDEGYNLAFDFVNDRAAMDLIARLDDLVEEYRGSIYKTKDAVSRLGQPVRVEKFQSVQNKRYLNGK
ncbi:FAD-binding oxidoreductase [Polluticaenibacter yanchengensis]|uniref:FAD-binding oxidoreductase n=1 Tax=Polluticaenibacter yanchengensis TaxID=3014562 RepID=A0ABT4UMK9_9BACT|nr:FAD-binding oxidoreductase [Chitinophagaceae bacterium LY-5]